MIEIYKATNRLNGKLYIGQTSRKLETRKSAHIRNSFNTNASDYNCAFHKAIRKHSPENFTWEVLLVCNTVEESNKAEMRLIAEHNTCHGVGYNSNEGGGSAVGFKHTEETRKKISEAVKRRPPMSNETKERMSKAQKIAHQSDSRKKRVFTAEQLEKYSQLAKDRELWKLANTPEVLKKRQATREANGGYTSVSERQKEDNVAHRPEVQKKISNSVKKLWEDPEYRANQLAKREQANPIVKCPYCEKKGRKTIMQRWHFDRCRFKK